MGSGLLWVTPSEPQCSRPVHKSSFSLGVSRNSEVRSSAIPKHSLALQRQ